MGVGVIVFPRRRTATLPAPRSCSLACPFEEEVMVENAARPPGPPREPLAEQLKAWR